MTPAPPHSCSVAPPTGVVGLVQGMPSIRPKTTVTPGQQAGPYPQRCWHSHQPAQAGAPAEVWGRRRGARAVLSPVPAYSQVALDQQRVPHCMALKCDSEGSYLRDADAVGLIVKCGCIVIHVPDLDVHLPRDHLPREGG